MCASTSADFPLKYSTVAIKVSGSQNFIVMPGRLCTFTIDVYSSDFSFSELIEGYETNLYVPIV